ncbi:response regulator [Arcobacter sp. LA11]|uniref:response regulator n=1 Tax=Arcobacter sp. LA11 TaxID=1898176 RepID=UPI000933726D|nr:response regulator [Arcobacter sp. LA11]
MQLHKYQNKILIVDDNPKNIQVAMNILKDYNVIYAQSGEKALELVKENDFDLILLDIVMPTMDGYEVCKVLKEDTKTKDIPIIFLTVKDDEKDIVEGFELGAVDYLVKPFYSEVLLKRVELHLKLSSSIKELTSLNDNLNDIVRTQIEDIRKKDEVLFKQSKMLALSEMIDMMSEQMLYPLGLIKLQNQALELKLISNNIENKDIEESVNLTNDQLNYLNITIEDFKSFFQQDVEADFMNLNVMVNRVLLFFKDMFIQNKIEVNVQGDIHLEVSFVKSELKHVLMKLIFNSINLLKNNNIKDKKINIFFGKKNDVVELDISSNVQEFDIELLNSLFDYNDIDLEGTNIHHLGLHLVKTLIEKNLSTIYIEKSDFGLCYCTKFYN